MINLESPREQRRKGKRKEKCVKIWEGINGRRRPTLPLRLQMFSADARMRIKHLTALYSGNLITWGRSYNLGHRDAKNKAVDGSPRILSALVASATSLRKLSLKTIHNEI